MFWSIPYPAHAEGRPGTYDDTSGEMVASDLCFSFTHGGDWDAPIDFYMMIGLPIGGTPPLSIDELDLEMVRKCIGSQPIE